MGVYVVRVDGRVFEKSETAERAEEIVEILKDLYPKSEVTVSWLAWARSGKERR